MLSKLPNGSITRYCTAKSMNQLFHNTAGGIEHQIRLEKQTTILEVIVRGKRNIKQNRNWFYINFSVESSSFIFNNFKREKFKLKALRLKKTSLSFVWFYQSVFLSKFVAFHRRTRIVTALMPSLLFRYFSLFLHNGRSLKKSEAICSRHHWHQRALSGF